MVSPSTVAEIGSLLGDPARVNMMIALLGGRAWTAGELADAAGVSPQTASSHLARLVAANMVRVEKQGRHRYHQISSPEVAQLIEQMHVAGAALAAARTPGAGPRDQSMRELRSCYDHLAGRVAVELKERLLGTEDDIDGPAFRTDGRALLDRIGIDIDALASGRRTVCRTCIDWSERRPHIAGALGASVLERFDELGWTRPRPASRALVITATGERGLAEVFSIQAVRTAL
jgi:DNA-binding transcriptional ArsR family regulator